LYESSMGLAEKFLELCGVPPAAHGRS